MYKPLVSGAALATLFVFLAAPGPAVLAQDEPATASQDEPVAASEETPAEATTPEEDQAKTEKSEATPGAYRYTRDWRREAGHLDRMHQQQRAWVEARRRAREAQHQAWLWWQDPVYESNKLWRDGWSDYRRDMARARSEQMREWARQQQDYTVGQEPFGPEGGYGDPYYGGGYGDPYYYGGGAPYGFGSGPWW
jgi:hypothetical protein